MAAGLAAPEGSSPGAGNTIEAVAEPGTVEEWDGESEIPKGKVVIGISEEYGQGPDSTYHFAISMGGGNVVNNRGSGPAIEEVGDVFGGVSGWRIYDKILIGDYRYVSGDQTNGANPADTSGTTTKGTSKVRNDTDEAISISSGGEQIGQTLSPGETSSALTGEGSSAVQINGPGEPSETARAIELLMAPGSHTVTPVRKGEDGFEAGTPEPTAAPCCGQPIFPLDFFHFSSPEAIARGCMSNLAWWLSGAAVILGLAIGLVFLLGGGDDPADQPSSEPAVEDQPADESAVDEPATEEQPVDQGDSGEAGEEEPDDPAEPEEPAGQSWSTSDETDLVNFNDGSAASDPLTEITGVTVTETDGCWSVTVELTGTDDAIDEASAAYDSIAYVLDVEFTDGTFGRWIWERHLGNELNGQDPDHPSAPAADVTFTDKTVTFKLPDDGRDIRRVWVSSFSNEEMGAEEFGPEVTDQVELEVPGSGG